MKYTSVSCNGLDQKGTDKMILEKQAGGRKAAKVLSCMGSFDSWRAGLQTPGYPSKWKEHSLRYYNEAIPEGLVTGRARGDEGEIRPIKNSD